jgi:hypothetical protein
MTVDCVATAQIIRGQLPGSVQRQSQVRLRLRLLRLLRLLMLLRLLRLLRLLMLLLLRLLRLRVLLRLLFSVVKR